MCIQSRYDVYPVQVTMCIQSRLRCASSPGYDVHPVQVTMCIQSRLRCASSPGYDVYPVQVTMCIQSRLRCVSSPGYDVYPVQVALHQKTDHTRNVSDIFGIMKRCRNPANFSSHIYWYVLLIEIYYYNINCCCWCGTEVWLSIAQILAGVADSAFIQWEPSFSVISRSFSSALL